MESTYGIIINDHTYALPIVQIGNNTAIAVLDMLNRPELASDAATELVNRISGLNLGQIDYLITPECKAISLTYAMADIMRVGMVVLRKSEKLYNRDAIKVEVKSITTDHLQELHLDKISYENLKGKRVLIVDDVVSTGGSINAVRSLIEQVPGCEIVAEACVCAEGQAHNRPGLIYLAVLPIMASGPNIDDPENDNFEVLEISHNERMSLVIRTKKNKYEVHLRKDDIIQVIGFIVQDENKVIYEDAVGANLFIPTDEKGIKVISDRVIEFLKKYESEV